MKLWFSPEDCNLEAFKASIAATRAAAPDTPFAARVEKDLPLYDCSSLYPRLAQAGFQADLMAEWAGVMQRGAGVIILKGCYPDPAPIDAATEIFNSIMADQRAAGGAGGDHFGTNDRIWNALEKLCLADPEVFARYYGNQMIAIACEAWLGPNYQMTSQTNLVNPGGEGQTAHRDYHLGFQTQEAAAAYPAAAHVYSQFLTLQGAIAHCDMPVASGPTKFLPFSQTYEPGYLAYTEPDFRAYFDENYVQLPLEKGDAVFFNPATFHGAGSNATRDIARLANLIQISSAFGRAMESIDRQAMCAALYPVLAAARNGGTMSEAQISAAIAACAEGYPFPTNLDRDPPVGGLAPKSQADLMRAALQAGDGPEAFASALKDHAQRRLT